MTNDNDVPQWEERLAPSDVNRVRDRIKAFGRLPRAQKENVQSLMSLNEDLLTMGLYEEEAEELLEQLCKANGTYSAFWPGAREDETTRF